MTRDDFLARCANAYDAGRATPETLRILDRWADMVMRLEGGQLDIFTQLWILEQERTENFHRGRTLANDALGYRAFEFMAILNHPCQICAEDPDAWHTRPGFCQHRKVEP